MTTPMPDLDKLARGHRETVAQQLDRDQRTTHTRGTLNRKLSRVLKAHIERNEG